MHAIADDFRAENLALKTLLDPLTGAGFDQPTLFKAWTSNDILRHLHFWNRAAYLQVHDEAELERLLGRVFSLGDPGGMRTLEREMFGGLNGHALLDEWSGFAEQLAARFAGIDPRTRLKWAGPSMSARSSLAARQMETWAHGQAIFDALGVARVNTDRIRNIVQLGANTFAWTFRVNGLPLPEARPFLSLTAPSGEVWTWGERDPDNMIGGTAEAFCQVVTQVRNIADVDLDTTGETAAVWMAKAQCFAGPPETPPAPGLRRPASG
ncbi:TIGR03084 family metal-binding protein [Maricaulis sp.]|uniref:TIGR03084 family metal-binding protein n=1 Tax=Maricaulis sp. TaxID=1486257 RepID=UPI003A8D9F4F